MKVIGNDVASIYLDKFLHKSAISFGPSHAPVILPSGSGPASRWSVPTSTSADDGIPLFLTGQRRIDDLVALIFLSRKPWSGSG